MSEKVISTSEPPCAACPWRRSNLNKPAPLMEGEKFTWYSMQNLKRLWKGMRDGERMTCHLTDSRQAQKNGGLVPDSGQTRECSGALILCQRELTVMQELGDLNAYRRARPSGMSKAGIRVWFERLILPFSPVGRPNLNEPDVHYDPLGEWKARGD